MIINIGTGHEIKPVATWEMSVTASWLKQLPASGAVSQPQDSVCLKVCTRLQSHHGVLCRLSEGLPEFNSNPGRWLQRYVSLFPSGFLECFHKPTGQSLAILRNRIDVPWLHFEKSPMLTYLLTKSALGCCMKWFVSRSNSRTTEKFKRKQQSNTMHNTFRKDVLPTALASFFPFVKYRI